MSAANDGAGAPTSERINTGIDTHGICIARDVRPGMQARIGGHWGTVTDVVTYQDETMIWLANVMSGRLPEFKWVPVIDNHPIS